MSTAARSRSGIPTACRAFATSARRCSSSAGARSIARSSPSAPPAAWRPRRCSSASHSPDGATDDDTRLMTTIDLAAWVNEVRGLVAELAAQDLTYPIGANEVRAPSPPAAPPALPSQLVALYAACDGLSLPDVHIGYFLDAADRVASARERGEPTFVADAQLPIHVFGSDGGG